MKGPLYSFKLTPCSVQETATEWLEGNTSGKIAGLSTLPHIETVYEMLSFKTLISFASKDDSFYWGIPPNSFIPPLTLNVVVTSWGRHQMETSSALLALCAGNSPVTGEFPTKRPVTRSFDAFFDLHLNKRLSKQSKDWWFETLSCPLWHHCNVIRVTVFSERNCLTRRSDLRVRWTIKINHVFSTRAPFTNMV